MVPSRGGWAQLCVWFGWKRPDRCRSDESSVVGGAAGAGTWGQVSSGMVLVVRGTWDGAVNGASLLQDFSARTISDPLSVLEQGPDRQRAPDWCSGGVSSINGASESRCSQTGPASRWRQWQQPIRHRSSPAATGLHEGASPGPPATAGWSGMAAVAERVAAAATAAAELMHPGRQLQRLGARAGQRTAARGFRHCRSALLVRPVSSFGPPQALAEPWRPGDAGGAG